MKKPNLFKKIIVGFMSVILFFVLGIGGYILYVSAQYYRIEDSLLLETLYPKTAVLNMSEDYSIITYNIGFGAYNHDFSFFMDTGVMKDGKEVAGTMSKAKSKEIVLTNTNGAIAAVKAEDADFYFFQEVDTDSTRSHHVNQFEMLKEIGDYSMSYAVNFHSAFLAYPLHDFHGTVNSGIATLSKYKIEESVRRSFPIDNSFPTKFFDLDRCFMVTRFSLNSGKELVLINLHMSAYDEGGLIRKQQLELLCDVMEEEYLKGNFVIAGGDFNHDIANSLNLFQTEQNVPEWVSVMNEEDLPENYGFASATNAPTCRSTDMPYVKGVNYTVVIDGFIVSDNIIVTEVKNIDTDFEFSDHNPVKLTFGFSN